MEWDLLAIKMDNEDFTQGHQRQKICFLSYNSRGFSDLKIEFMNLLLSQEVVGDKLPILCNQENFILRDNSYKLTRAFPGYHVLVNPAIKNTHDKGRPKNGMFIAYPEILKNSVSDVSPNYWRLQAIKIKLGNFSTLLINSYFPTDNRRPDSDELLEILSNIKEVIRKNEFDALMWAGDINADFIRNTYHTTTTSDTIDDLDLTKSWDNFKIDFTHCHEHLGVCHVSILAHNC